MMDFTDLKVWQKARQLCVETYRTTDGFPPKERFGLCDQIRRAAVSICTNIAEGYGRGGGKDFAYHLRIARGSANEVHCCTIVASDLRFLGPPAKALLEGLVVEVKKMLTGFLKRLDGLP